ncbi:3-oxoacyl-ACP synthase [Sphingobacteriaceae bacterium]|nr:3-oxoacyl-ACP synthase [Sphingobacteriaceae bacterium]
METSILSYCKIKNNSVWINGTLVAQAETNEEATTFLATLYKTNELNYPKFFKMDKLCKLGVLTTELVIRSIQDFSDIPKNKIALVFSNSASSLETDRTHAKTIADKENYFPSPSVFVYTLANIVIGEIAIKHKITGENAFFVSEKFDAELMASYTATLLQDTATTTVLAGWINVDGPDLEAFVYCVKNLNFKQEKNTGNPDAYQQEHNSKNIHYLYSL